MGKTPQAVPCQHSHK